MKTKVLRFYYKDKVVLFVNYQTVIALDGIDYINQNKN
jgi:hypothetical protein